MNKRRWITLGFPMVVVLLAILIWSKWSKPGRLPLDREPLDRSPFLAGIIEPITIIDGMCLGDGGSLCLRFQDSKGVVKDICLEESIYDDHDLILNAFIPNEWQSRHVPNSGVEERAFLGLLERWADHDSDANILMLQIERRKQGLIKNEAFEPTLSDEQKLKLIPVAILVKLRRRN
jgi:hypothetical protein